MSRILLGTVYGIVAIGFVIFLFDMPSKPENKSFIIGFYGFTTMSFSALGLATWRQWRQSRIYFLAMSVPYLALFLLTPELGLLSFMTLPVVLVF